MRGTLVGGRLRVQTALGELTVDLDELREFRAELPPAPAAPPGAAGTPAAAPVVSPPPAPTPAPADGPPANPPDGPRQDVGRTVADAAAGTAQATKRAVDRVHDGFKAFGEAVWEGMKSAGRAFQGAFTRGIDRGALPSGSTDARSFPVRGRGR